MSSLHLVWYFGYYCGPCVLPPHIILMIVLKTKTQSQPKTNHKNLYRKTIWSKMHVWIKLCFDYKLNCCNSNKMFSVAVSWWRSSGASAAGIEVESLPSAVQVRNSSQGWKVHRDERSLVGCGNLSVPAAETVCVISATRGHKQHWDVLRKGRDMGRRFFGCFMNIIDYSTWYWTAQRNAFVPLIASSMCR